jgi:glycosyltransferase involved in cell wall biosynthesis
MDESSVGRVLVVVPAWNESEALPGLLVELQETVPHLDVLVVDDGSTDGTADVVRSSRRAQVLVLPFNVGVGGAMRAGFLYALRHGYGTVVQVDADGQHDPADIPRLLALVAEGHDVAIGARFAGVGDYPVRGPRWWAMRLLARSVSRLARVVLTDVTSGFRASSPAAVRLYATDYPPEYLGDTVESLVLAGRAGLRLGQVPVAMRARRGGQPSQSAFRATLYLARALLVLALAVVHTSPSESAA